LTALACVLALAGCGRSDKSPASGGGAESADAVVKALNSFTDDMLSKVESAADTKAGVAEAQALLDARKAELAGRLAALKKNAQDSGARGSLLEAEVDNTDRVHRLQLKYADAAARDAGLKSGLERLINDYDALFR
jgi:hypothetical protein